MRHAQQRVSPLDPVEGPAIRFTKIGNRWHLGNRPARVASVIAENDNGEIVVTELGADGEAVETTIFR